MAMNVIAVSCDAGDWTEIGDSVASLAFQWRDDKVIGRWTASPTKPDINTTHYWTLRPKQPQSINQMAFGDKLWAMPEGVDAVLETVTP